MNPIRTKEEVEAEINEAAQEYSTKCSVDFDVARLLIAVGYDMGASVCRDILLHKIEEAKQ